MTPQHPHNLHRIPQQQDPAQQIAEPAQHRTAPIVIKEIDQKKEIIFIYNYLTIIAILLVDLT